MCTWDGVLFSMKAQLDLLTHLFTFRCIRPNPHRASDSFNADLVMDQLQCNGLLEVAQIRRDGYSVRMFPQEFLDRYVDLFWPRGYKTVFILNSTEHEISTAHTN